MPNPYAHTDFFSFFGIAFARLWALVTGQLSFDALVSDEIQMLVLGCVAISGALLGTFLVLRRMTMLANALSHTILLGIVVAYLLVQDTLSLPVLMVAALITGVMTTFLTEVLTRTAKLQEDASIGLVFNTLFALGVVLVSLYTRNLHLGTELVMGNVDALVPQDLKVVFSVLVMNGALVLLLYKGFKVTTFDSGLARALGFSPIFFNYLLMVQTSATAIGGFRAVGVLMVLAFLVAPVLTARLLTHSLHKMLLIAAGLGLLASVIGVALSRHILTYAGVGLSTSGIVVCTLLVFYVVALTISQVSLYYSKFKLAKIS